MVPGLIPQGKSYEIFETINEIQDERGIIKMYQKFSGTSWTLEKII